MYVIDLPLRVAVSKKDMFSLNLNVYRNEPFFKLDKAKKVFKAIVTPLLKDVPVLEGCTLTYTYFAPSQRKADVANVCSVVDKFFSDALVEAGRLSDDNCSIVPMVVYRFGGVDKGHPRVEVTIEPTGSVDVQPAANLGSFQLREKSMQLKLVQTEIEAAITNHVTSMMTLKDGMRIDIALSATRGEDGFIAVVDIVPNGHPQVAAEPAAAQSTAAKPALAFGAKPQAPAPVAPKPAAAPILQRQVAEPKPAAQPEPDLDEEVVQELVDEGTPFVEESVEEVTLVEEPAPAIRSAPENRVDPNEDRDLGVEGGAPLPRKASIFQNLVKPVNPKPVVAESVE